MGIMSGIPAKLPAVRPALPAVPFDAVPAPNVPLHIARKKFERAVDEKEKEEALTEYGKITFMRQFVDSLFDKLESVVNFFHEKCFNLGQNGYPLRKTQLLANLCEANVNEAKIKAVLSGACLQGPWDGAH